jgi:dipeptidyl aminopeptidase/acylaminoacyl peptidase
MRDSIRKTRHGRNRKKNRKLSWSRTSGVLLLCLVVSLSLPIPKVTAQKVAALSIQDVIETHSLGETSSLAISPDGRRVAYMVRDDRKTSSREESVAEGETGVPSRDRGGQIWVSNTETGESQNLTGGKGSSWDPTWSPDGEFLAFLWDERGCGEAMVWLWDGRKKTAKPVSSASVREIRYRGIQWSPNGNQLAITMIPNGLSSEAYVHSIKLHDPSADTYGSAREVKGSRVKVYESLRAAPEADGNSAGSMFNLDAAYLRDLTVVDIATGRSSTIVQRARIGWYSISPDGAWLAYASPNRFVRMASFQRIYDLVAVNLKGGEKRQLASDVLLDDVFSWSPDSSLISFGAFDSRDKSYCYFVVGLDGARARAVAALPPRSFTGGFSWMPLWSSSGRDIFFVRDGTLMRSSIETGSAREVARIPGHSITHRLSPGGGLLLETGGGESTVVIAHDDARKADAFYRINLTTGVSTPLLEKEECYTCKVGVDLDSYEVAVSQDKKWVTYVAEDARHAPDLWIADINFKSSRRLTHLNPQLDAYRLGQARLLTWLSNDGEEMHGTILLPPDNVQGKKYPLLVYVYPGVRLSENFDRFGLGEFPGPLNLQLFATRGYAVLLPDARDRVGDRIGALVGSVLPGVNKAIEQGFADPERVGVIGHSQGGYASLVLITQTTRFKGAVEIAGWSDFVGMFGIMNDDGTGFQYGQTERQLGGTPWQIPTRYVQNSPLFLFDRVETPLLAVHGSRDDAIAGFLGDEIFVALRRLGKRVQYAKYVGASHSPRDWPYEDQVDMASRVINWVDLYVGGSRVDSK